MNTRYCWILGLSLLVAVGCQHKKAPVESNRTGVTGKVTIDGRPLTGGGITFISSKDPMYRVSAMIQPDGSFRVADAPEGPVGVAVETESSKMGNAANYMPIPTKYGDVKTSGLKAEIKKGNAAPLAFDLKSK